MIEIATIIPYYQREPGILRKALASIYAQCLEPDRRVDVIIVDDASPSPPDLDLTDPPPPQFSVRVLRRENGGPGAARNTGLDAVPPDTDFIAFLDSDDAWVPDHLERALATLGEDADFYFCDQENQPRQGNPTTRFGCLCAQSNGAELHDCGLPHDIVDPHAAGNTLVPRYPDGSYQFIDREGLTCLIRSFLPHLSVTVVRTQILGCVRFRGDLRAAGEDYLYFLMLANEARKACYSKRIGVSRGCGVSVFESMVSWDNPASLTIMCDALRALLVARAILDLDLPQRRLLEKRIYFRRMEAVARVLADVSKRRCPTVSPLIQADAGIIWRFPALAAQALLRKIRMKPIAEYLRASELR